LKEFNHFHFNLEFLRLVIGGVACLTGTNFILFYCRSGSFFMGV